MSALEKQSKFPLEIIKNRSDEEAKTIATIAKLMNDAGTFHQFDSMAVSLLARTIARLEELPDLDLTDRQEIILEQKLMMTINRYLLTLGLTKSKQLELQSSLRGRGRPTKSKNLEGGTQSADWEGLLDE